MTVVLKAQSIAVAPQTHSGLIYITEHANKAAGEEKSLLCAQF